MIPKQIVIISKQTTSKKFLTDPTADLHLSLKNQIFSVHRDQLTQCQFIQSQCDPLKKIHLIDEPLNERMMQRVLGFFYGYDISLDEKEELVNFLDVIDFLQAKILIERVQGQILKDIEGYDVFFLMNLAFQFNLTKILQKCFFLLEEEQFQQVNYNKFDLVQCDFRLFQIVMNRHNRLKRQGKILGQSYENIQELICLYCRRYQYQEQTVNRMLEKYGDPEIRTRAKPHTDRIFIQKTEINVQENQNNSVKEKPITKSTQQTSLKVVKQIQEKESVSPSSKQVSPFKLKIPSQRRKGRFSEGSNEIKIENKKCQRQQTINEGEENQVQDQKGDDKREVRISNTYLSVPSSSQALDKKFSDSSTSMVAPHNRFMKIISNDYGAERVLSGVDDIDSLGDLEDDEEDPEEFAGKISTLLGQYQMAVQQHENNFQAIKKSGRSMIFRGPKRQSQDSNSQTIFNVGKFTSSRNLETNLMHPFKMSQI